MHWTTHVATGAAAGYMLGHPLAAVVLGFASHPLLDMAPHYDPDSELGYILDAAAGCVALGALAANRAIRRTDRHHAAFWGAMGSALPDVELLVKLVKDVDPEDYIFPWHNGRLPHRQTHVFFSTVSQIGLTVVMLGLILLRLKQRRLTRA